jgi:zinc protease
MDDPKGLEGLTHLASRMLFEGTRRRGTQELAERMEGLGIHADSDVRWENTVFRFAFPPALLDPAMDLLEEMFFEPALRAEDFERLRAQQRSNLSKEFKDPGILASRLANALLLKGTRQAHPSRGLPQTLERIQCADVEPQLNVLRTHGLTLLLCGNAGTREEERARRLAGAFSGKAMFRRRVLRGPVRPPALYFCGRPQSVQSEIRVASFGPGPAERIHVPAHILNTTFGGKFSSRLNMNLRERHGFTYGAKSFFLERRKFSAFTISVAVANDVTYPALEEVMREMDTARDGSLVEAEVSAAAGYLEGSFFTSLDEPSRYLGRVVNREASGLPSGRFRSYLRILKAARAADLAAVPRDFLDRNKAVVVVVGDPHVLESLKPLDLPIEEVSYP